MLTKISVKQKITNVLEKQQCKFVDYNSKLKFLIGITIIENM